MKRPIVFVSVAAASCWIAASAANSTLTPAKRIADFQRVLPAGQKAQMVWIQYELNKTGGRQGCIYGVDSDTGVVHRITSPDSMDAWNPHITADGTRVVFFNWNKGDVRVVNWNGTGVKSVYAGVGSVEDYYQDPVDKSEWAVTYNPLAKINLNTTGNGQFVGLPGGPGDDGIRISPDGKYYASDITGGARFGLTNCSTGATTFDPCPGTCICNVSPDSTYRMSVQYSGHHAVYICRVGSTTGVEYKPDTLDKNIRATLQTVVNPNCTQGNSDGFESTRWVAPDYMTFSINDMKEGPFLLKLSDPKVWLYVQDTLDCDMGKGFGSTGHDARIFTRSGTGVSNGSAGLVGAANFNASSAHCESYLPDGRRLDPSVLRTTGTPGPRIHGVVIRRSESEGINGSKVTVVQ